ncbi:MAG: class I SAM-dependent methyltransferase [Alphaproteobacteria bacterium]
MVLQAQAFGPLRARRADERDGLSRLGKDALTEPAASTSRWDAGDYARVGAFVADLGQAALDLLDPKPGERILDIGCGDGTLTRRIAERGAEVVGIDSSPEMVAAARAKGLDARLIDVTDMRFQVEFDAAFSNATLHWVLEKERAAEAVFEALHSGGRFAGEMGGEGNLQRLREALDSELVIRGYVPPSESSNWYPSPEEFAFVYEEAGFEHIDVRLVERPTEIAHGIAEWVTTFRKGWLDRAGVPDEERAELAAAVADRFGSNVADYVRLRFIMRKPA